MSPPGRARPIVPGFRNASVYAIAGLESVQTILLASGVPVVEYIGPASYAIHGGTLVLVVSGSLSRLDTFLADNKYYQAARVRIGLPALSRATRLELAELNARIRHLGEPVPVEQEERV